MPDSVPNYLTIDPATGKVSADFSGHVRAAGIDLTAGVGTPPNVLSTVRWLRQSDGSQVGQVFAVEAGDDSAALQAISPESANVRQAQLTVVAGRSSGDIAQAQAFATSVTHPAGHVGIIIRDDGTSGYVQTRGASNTFLSWAEINSAGGVMAASPDVTAARSGLGTYRVTLSGGNYFGPYVAIATALSSGVIADCSNIGAGALTIETRIANTNALADASFAVIAIASIAP